MSTSSKSTEQFTFSAGVSGFWGKKDTPPSSFEPLLFQQKCEELTNIGFTLEAIFFAPKKKYSYHLGLLKKDNEQYLIFCNRYYPIVAFAQPNAPIDAKKLNDVQPPANFIESELLAAYFNQEPFQVIPSDILQLEVDADNPETIAVVHQLYDAEFAEFAFWEPRSMGDLAFNCWG